jgi:ABC-type uncharacterized transport system permease subunit
MPPKSNYGFALGLAGQMLATIVLGVLVGSWIDSNDPPRMGILFGSLIGTVVATVLVVFQAKKNEDQ